MKLIVLIFLVTFSSFAFAETKCFPPEGKYTDIEMVLNQFVLNNGNPNWGDWCFEGAIEDREPCVKELDAWDEWLVCAGLVK